MVYIKRIDLRGFKTFGKKTTIHLDRGLTIITGPNGSGKSNVLDGVKFALGELSPKELRGETISDLVYKGAAQTVHTRAAYVAVQFDNHDRRIPIDAEAVTISREFRRGGEGIYRLNGKRISRKQLTDILSSADIQVSSFNIVPQHAITRLAEVTTEERRKIIEDMIGIAVYDTKRASSQAELQQADLNLQVASAKIEEVRLRVESLEREKNEYLKFVQVRNEINQLQAKEVSFKVRKGRDEVTHVNREIAECQQRIQEVKSNRDTLLNEKSQIDVAKREVEESLAEAGSNKLFDLQRKMGDVSATIAGLRAKANAIEAGVKAFQKQRSEVNQKSIELSQRITESTARLPELKDRRNRMSEEIAEKQAVVNQSSDALHKLRQSLGETSREAQEVDRTISTVTQRVIKTEAQIETSTAKIDLLEKHHKTLSSRKTECENLIQSIQDRIEDLNKVQQRELAIEKENDRKITAYTELTEQRVREVKQAEEVAKRAATALVELETQRKIANTLTSEDKALGLIEQMSKAGALPDIHGRLGTLVKFRAEYRKAVEAAAAGWMKALVVKNIESAVACIEVLKKTRVGRIKLIPTEGGPKQKRIRTPDGIEGVVGPIIDIITFDHRFKDAVYYVFGDTILTLNQKAAFLVSLRGTRAVAMTGDLYESSGAMETGYFRQPADFTGLLLAGQTADQLKTTLTSLEGLASKTEEDVARLSREVEELRKSKAKTQNFLQSTGRETESFKSSIDRTRRTMEETISRIEGNRREIATEEAIVAACSSLQQKIRSQLNELENKRATIKFPFSTAQIQSEDDYTKLTGILNDLLRQRLEIESQIQSQTSTLSVLEPSLADTMEQIKDIDNQLITLKEDHSRTLNELEDSQSQLKNLEVTRNGLSEELSVFKRKRDEFETHLKKIDSEITRILDQLDPLNSDLAQLTASEKNFQMQIQFHMNELRELGYNDVVNFESSEMEQVTKTIAFLKKELTSIGAVNELAVSQYEEVKENYKHLATRIYELEKEKLSIIKFMNELDRQKLDAFMKAFNQVSQSFNEIFSTVTGGAGRLFLEKPEMPFEAGADLRLQFPGKTEMTVGSASGGEKSVGTVCFILALQSIHPMPFYMMDEIDAHLDVLNSQHLADLLKHKSQGSQFITVSLKDVTITRGDTVYGVFIQDGVSQVVSLPMQEVNVAGRAN